MAGKMTISITYILPVVVNAISAGSPVVSVNFFAASVHVFLVNVNTMPLNKLVGKRPGTQRVPVESAPMPLISATLLRPPFAHTGFEPDDPGSLYKLK